MLRGASALGHGSGDTITLRVGSTDYTLTWQFESAPGGIPGGGNVSWWALAGVTWPIFVVGSNTVTITTPFVIPSAPGTYSYQPLASGGGGGLTLTKVSGSFPASSYPTNPANFVNTGLVVPPGDIGIIRVGVNGAAFRGSAFPVSELRSLTRASNGSAHNDANSMNVYNASLGDYKIGMDSSGNLLINGQSLNRGTTFFVDLYVG